MDETLSSIRNRVAHAGPMQSWPPVPNVAVASRVLVFVALVTGLGFLTMAIGTLVLATPVALLHYIVAVALTAKGIALLFCAGRMYQILIKGKGRRRA